MMKLKTILAVGFSAIAAVIWMVSARAVPPQQSDSTGTNTWNNTAPIFEVEGQLDPAAIARARELSQALKDAYAACVASVEATADAPRRFARGPRRNSDKVCISAECTQYNRLIEETKTFLSSLDLPEEERLRAIQNLRTW